MPVNADNNSPDGKIRVLALEDDRVVRRVLSDILSNECAFKAVETYSEFSALLNTFNPDVLLLDRMLPDGDGLSICRELRSNSQYEKLFILMLTADSHRESIEEGYAAGVNDYIRKPFVPYEVQSKIQNCKKIITFQNKLFSAFNSQLEFSKRLYRLNRMIQTNIDITDVGVLVKEFETINQILDVGYVEVVLAHKDELTVELAKTFDTCTDYLPYARFRKKVRLFDERSISITGVKIRSEEKKDLYCTVAPIVCNNRVAGYFVLQRDFPFDAEEKNIISLCSDFLSIMMERLLAQKELKRQYSMSKAEIAKVRKIQVSFLPHFRDIEGYDVASLFLPAQDISGDFFDGFYLDEDVYQFVLCDVSGHGMASSYIGNEIRSLFKTFSLRKFSPSFIINAVNNILVQDISITYYFATVVVCQLHLRSGKLVYASGGHPPGFYFRQAGATLTLLEKTGSLVGFFEKSEFGETVLTMESGDCLLLYTDGITETCSACGDDLYGEERLLQQFGMNANLPSKDLLHTLVGTMYEFSGFGMQMDDVTMICIKKR